MSIVSVHPSELSWALPPSGATCSIGLQTTALPLIGTRRSSCAFVENGQKAKVWTKCASQHRFLSHPAKVTTSQ